MSFACRAVVVVWIAGYLAWSAGGAPIEPLVAPARVTFEAAEARVREPEAKPVPTPVTAAGVEQGEALLDAPGSFPALTCRYDRFEGFTHYARAMHALGARFVVVRQRRIVGEWDLAAGKLREPTLGGAYSPRARDYSEEPALRDVASRARTEFGAGAEVMMLVPRVLDAGLFGGVATALRERGDSHHAYRELRGRYQRGSGGGVQIVIEDGLRPDGSVAPIDLVFDLAEIAAVAEGA